MKFGDRYIKFMKDRYGVDELYKFLLLICFVLIVINTFNISARYDDYKKTFEEKCTNEYTTLQFKNIEEVQKWLKEQ